MSLADLAVATAVVPESFIADFETGEWIGRADLDAIQDALEKAGGEFLEDGVRLRKGGKWASLNKAERF